MFRDSLRYLGLVAENQTGFHAFRLLVEKNAPRLKKLIETPSWKTLKQITKI